MSASEKRVKNDMKSDIPKNSQFDDCLPPGAINKDLLKRISEFESIKVQKVMKAAQLKQEINMLEPDKRRTDEAFNKYDEIAKLECELRDTDTVLLMLGRIKLEQYTEYKEKTEKEKEERDKITKEKAKKEKEARNRIAEATRKAQETARRNAYDNTRQDYDYGNGRNVFDMGYGGR